MSCPYAAPQFCTMLWKGERRANCLRQRLLCRAQVCQPHEAVVVEANAVDAERAHLSNLPGHVRRRNDLRRNEAQSLADGHAIIHEALQIVNGARENKTVQRIALAVEEFIRDAGIKGPANVNAVQSLEHGGLIRRNPAHVYDGHKVRFSAQGIFALRPKRHYGIDTRAQVAVECGECQRVAGDVVAQAAERRQIIAFQVVDEVSSCPLPHGCAVHACRLSACHAMRTKAETQQILSERIQLHAPYAVVDVVLKAAEMQELQLYRSRSEVISNVADQRRNIGAYIGIAWAEIMRECGRSAH